MLHITVPEMWNSWYNAFASSEFTKLRLGDPDEKTVPLSPDNDVGKRAALNPASREVVRQRGGLVSAMGTLRSEPNVTERCPVARPRSNST